MAECTRYEENRAKCNCTYEPCSRKGTCCQCLHYHRQMGELPACYFPDDVEQTFDRSIRRFVSLHK
jgi:hypothetical protein